MSKTKMTLIWADASIGCDPEIFFRRHGRVVGSERFIPEEGLACQYLLGYKQRGMFGESYTNGSVVRDGVQAEIHPAPSRCRANLGNAIQANLLTLRDHLPPDVSVDFSQLVEVDPMEFYQLSPTSRRLGCIPSFNIHGRPPLDINGEDVRVRMGGGHIHVGSSTLVGERPTIAPSRAVLAMNLLVGNTCVLLDRDPAAVERRKMYGRAGEYRLPSWGMEYRTLSNFWMQAYPLLSFIAGLTKIAISMLYTPLGLKQRDNECTDWYDRQADPASDTLVDAVDPRTVEDAINTNDRRAALDIFKHAVVPFARTHQLYSCFTNPGDIKAFLYFVDKIDKEGLKYWFPGDPMQRWCEQPEGHTGGWETFLDTTVVPDMQLSQGSKTA